MPASEDNEIHRTLGRVEGKLDALLEAQTVQRSERDELRREVSSLRSRQDRYAGAFGIIAVALALKDQILHVFR